MSKPDWKDAPEWATWLAADTTDDESKPEFWVWFECRPEWDGGGWIVGLHGTRWDQLTNFPVSADFDSFNSLEQRP